MNECMQTPLHFTIIVQGCCAPSFVQSFAWADVDCPIWSKVRESKNTTATQSNGERKISKIVSFQMMFHNNHRMQQTITAR